MTKILAIILMGMLVFMGVKIIQHRPELFQSKALSKGFGTLGFLALGLIALVSIGVMILEAS